MGYRFFVYRLSIDEGMKRVFYVGKGTGNRPDQHAVEADRGHCCVKCSIIRYVLRKYGQYWSDIQFETDDSSEALWYEMKLISSYPYGRLSNVQGGFVPSISVTTPKQVGKGWAAKIKYADGTDTDMTASSREELIHDLVIEYDRTVLPEYFKHNHFGIKLSAYLK